ncbi:MAG: YciI family protein [Chloroflexota bacterium]|nr:YciI family protein [Chloroflexota bacterium]
MKYMLLIYQNAVARQALPESEKQALMDEADRIVKELFDTGEFVGGEGLADPSIARSVRVRDGVAAITDGPFAEAKEQMVGYCIVDCESMDRAVAIATRWPDARLWGMEVRPILSPDGIEM